MFIIVSLLCKKLATIEICSIYLIYAVYLRFQIFTAVTMKNAIVCAMTPCGSCKSDVSDERIASIIRVERISALGTTYAVTSN
jgi:hypothetical protein